MTTINRDITISLGSEDGGMNFEEDTESVQIYKDNLLDEVVVSGLFSGEIIDGVITLKELKSLCEDMEYINSKE